MAVTQPTRFTNDVQFAGAVTMSGTFRAPAGSIDNTAVSASAAIAATKVIHQFPVRYAQAPGTAIVAATQDLYIVQGATASIVAVEAAVTGAIASGDYSVSVDIQKSTGGGSFATILSATLDFDSGTTVRVAEAATVSNSSLVDGDILRVVITASGSSGAQGQGLVVTVFVREEPS